MLYAILFMASFWCNWCSFESFPSLNGCIWGFRRWMKATTSQTVFFPDQLKWEGAYWVEETFYLLNGLTMRLVWLLSKDLSPKQNCQLNLYISTVMLYDLPLIKQQFQCACLSIQDFYEPTGWTGHKFITPFHIQNFSSMGGSLV